MLKQVNGVTKGTFLTLEWVIMQYKLHEPVVFFF